MQGIVPPSPIATLQKSEVLTLTPTFDPLVLQNDLRFSWWPPVAAADGDACPILADVSPALGLTAINLGDGGASVKRLDSKWQYSVDLDGVADYFGATDEADLNVTGSVTFTAWVKLETNAVLNVFHPILSKMGASGTNGEYRLAARGTLNQARVRFDFVTPSGIYAAVESNAVLRSNEWVFVAAYYDATKRVIGVVINNNRKEIAVGTTAGTYSTANDFEIGAHTGMGYFWNGKIDEVTRWNRTLTVEEMEWVATHDLWDGVLPVIRAASGDPLSYPILTTDLPADPTGLEGADDGSGEVDLAWCNNALGLGNIEVWRADDGGASALLTRLDNTVGSYHDSGADATAHSYDYKIRATNENGASGFTADVHLGVGTANTFVDPEGGDFTDPEGGTFSEA